VGRIGLPELLIIALIILVLFGAPRIPQLMRGLGQGIREFRREIRGEDEGPKEPK
jgi:sec-independent protein translocase protein TatA